MSDDTRQIADTLLPKVAAAEYPDGLKRLRHYEIAHQLAPAIIAARDAAWESAAKIILPALGLGEEYDAAKRAYDKARADFDAAFLAGLRGEK